MSSTNRGAERQEHDFYKTPVWAIHALLQELWNDPQSPWAHIMRDHQQWLEPCAGDGVIIQTVNEYLGEYRPWWAAVELRDEQENLTKALESGNKRFGLFCPQDFLTWQETTPVFNVGLTNVPFDLAEPIVERAIQICEYFITLQRLNWLETEDRYYWHKDHPSDHLVLSSRCQFLEGINPKPNKDGLLKPYTADSCAYAWFIFGPGCGSRYKILETPDYHPQKIKAARKYELKCHAAQHSIATTTNVETIAIDDDEKNGCSPNSETAPLAHASIAESH